MVSLPTIELPKTPIFNSIYETFHIDDKKLNKFTFPGDPYTHAFNLNDLELDRYGTIGNNGVIGSGKYVVKKFLHKPTGRKMAVKYVHIPICKYEDKRKSSQKEKLLREIDIHERLNFSNYVVSTYGFCKNDEHLLICMELMEMSLTELYHQIHEEFSNFPENLLGYIGVAVIEGLCDLFSVKVLHRDIKPNNILVNTTSGEVRFF